MDSPEWTLQGVTRANRRVWTTLLMAPSQSPSAMPQIVAVHTLRNWNMSNTTLASASVAITFGMTSWVTSLSRSSAEDVLAFLGLAGSLEQFKIVIIIFVYMAAFFAFTQSMRYFSGYKETMR